MWVLCGFAFTLLVFVCIYLYMIVYCIACLTIIISYHVISRKVIEAVLGWAARDCGCTDTVGYVCLAVVLSDDLCTWKNGRE